MTVVGFKREVLLYIYIYMYMAIHTKYKIYYDAIYFILVLIIITTQRTFTHFKMLID